MKIIKMLCLLASVFYLLPLTTVCSDSGYSQIKFKKFPDKYQQYNQFPWETFENEEFSKAYSKILNDFPENLYRDDFIFKLHVVSRRNRFLSTNQGYFVFMDGCKPHFCGWSDISVLYDLNRSQAWAYVKAEDFISDVEYEVWLGRPDEKTKNLIKKLRDMWLQ